VRREFPKAGEAMIEAPQKPINLRSSVDKNEGHSVYANIA